MQVFDLMSKDVISVEQEESAAVAARILGRHNLGCLPVCREDGSLSGMLTDRDIVLRCIAADRDPHTVQVRDIMSNRVVSVSPEDTAEQAAALMGREQLRRLPVQQNGKLVGMVTLADVVQRHSMEAAACLCEICSNIQRR